MKVLGDRRGIAVLITLTVIALLIMTAMELNRRAGTSVDYTGAVRDRVTLNAMAASGIHAGMALLIKDKNESGDVDSLQEEWADAGVLEEVVQDLGFDDGKLTLVISDELSRIQVNALVTYPEGRSPNEPQWQMWLRFLSYARPPEGLDDDDTSPSAIVDSIKDWIDWGDDDAVTGINGAESDYYQSQTPPYSCPNGPIRHINELLLVKGVSKLAEAIGGADMISQYVTEYGMTDQEGKKYTFPGTININTAEAPVIAAMLPEDEFALAQDIVAYREETSEGQYVHQDLKSKTWYKKVPGLADITIKEALITTQSDFFRIVATPELHNLTMTTVAVVKREKEKKTGKWRCRVLSWRSE